MQKGQADKISEKKPKRRVRMSKGASAKVRTERNKSTARGKEKKRPFARRTKRIK
jgi:hypothetical protein